MLRNNFGYIAPTTFRIYIDIVNRSSGLRREQVTTLAQRLF